LIKAKINWQAQNSDRAAGGRHRARFQQYADGDKAATAGLALDVWENDPVYQSIGEIKAGPVAQHMTRNF